MSLRRRSLPLDPRATPATHHGPKFLGEFRRRRHSSDIARGSDDQGIVGILFTKRQIAMIKAGTVSDELVGLVDWMATCAEIAGVRLPADAAEDSFSILPALLDPKPARPVRDHAIYHSLHGEFSIEQGEWKLMLNRGSGGFSIPRQVQAKPGEPAGQLYNLRRDPQESRNCYTEHPEVVTRLVTLLKSIQRDGHSAVR